MGTKWRGVAGKAIASVLLIAVFCFVPVYMLYQNAVQSSGALRLTAPRALGQGANGNFGPATRVYSSPRSSVCVALEFLGFDPSSSTATLAFAVSATGASSSAINQAVVAGGTSGLLVISSNFGLSAVTIPFPLGELGSGELSPACYTGKTAPYLSGVGFRADESVYLLGQPRAFPDDWYELDDTVTVYVCPVQLTQDTCAAQMNQQGEASFAKVTTPPVAASVIATTRDQDLAMTIGTGGTLDPNIQNGVRFRFVVERSTWFVIYTYLIAAMPFILIFGLFLAYTRQAAERKGGLLRYSPERTVPAVYEIAFGVAATLVAILPLRAVLVPSSLPSLTRLDLVFGIGIALLVALSLTWVYVWSRPTPTESPEKAGATATTADGPLEDSR
jgi:hypothetical protein